MMIQSRNHKLMTNFSVGSEHNSKLNWKKELENLRTQYTRENDWEITVSELIANSIDAEARKIEIILRERETAFESEKEPKVTITFKDDGQGMNDSSFEEYHNLSSLSKMKSGSTIGFAGVGAKLSLDLCSKIYTETSQDSKTIASEWSFKGNNPIYTIVNSGGLLINQEHGTTVVIYDLSAPNISLKGVINTIKSNYSVALSTKKILIKVNGQDIKSKFQDLNIEKESKTYAKEFKYRGQKMRLHATFYLLKEGIDNNVGKSGIDIVVAGKTIIGGEWFDALSNIPFTKSLLIAGYVECNELLKAVKLSKDEINKKSPYWRALYASARPLFVDWLKSIGFYKDQEKSRNDQKMAKEIEKTLNKIIERNKDLFESLIFKNFTGRKDDSYQTNEDDDKKSRDEGPAILDPIGKFSGSVADTGNLYTGTHGGDGYGSDPKVPGEGDDPSTDGITSDYDEDVKFTRKKTMQRRRGSINLLFSDLNEKIRVRWQSDTSTFIINSGHPAYIFAQETGTYTEFMYTINEIFRFVLESQEDNSDMKYEERIWSLYEELMNTIE